MSLSLRARVDARGFDVQLEIGTGERVAILGPNGAGKSTLLAVLAGTLRSDAGRAELASRMLFDITDGRGRWLAPHERRVALLSQDPLLFPNLTVLDNVAFGPRAAGTPRRVAERTARQWLDRVDAAALAGRRPGQLSGGQAQRVAIARAVAAEPQLLLLDEPLAALDVTAAPLVRRVLRDLLAQRTMLVVTHDLLDAVLLSDRVIVLESGRIVESGPTAAVLRQPTSEFTARLAGRTLIIGTATADGLRATSGMLVSAQRQAPLTEGERAIAVFSPSAVSIHRTPPDGSPRNVFAVTIAELEPREDLVRVRAVSASGDNLTADVTPAAVGDLDLYPGAQVHYAIKATAIASYPG